MKHLFVIYILQYYSYFVGLKQNKINTSVFSSRANLLANMLVPPPPHPTSAINTQQHKIVQRLEYLSEYNHTLELDLLAVEEEPEPRTRTQNQNLYRAILFPAGRGLRTDGFR